MKDFSRAFRRIMFYLMKRIALGQKISLKITKITKNFKFFDFCFLAQNGRKYVETCSAGEIFTKNSILKNFPIVAHFWDIENFRKNQNFRFLFFGPKWTEIYWNVLSWWTFYEKLVRKNFFASNFGEGQMLNPVTNVHDQISPRSLRLCDSLFHIRSHHINGRDKWNR